MTVRLAAALQQHRHLRGSRVLCHDDGRPLAEHVMTDLLAMVGRRANVRSNGLHILRHTFCSHLAMKGAPARAIQELAGHRDLATTQRPWPLLEAAMRIGPAVSTLCDHIHQHEGEAGVRRIRAGRYRRCRQAALDLGVPTYRFLRRYLERRPPVPLTLRQVDPLIRQLTLMLKPPEIRMQPAAP